MQNIIRIALYLSLCAAECEDDLGRPGFVRETAGHFACVLIDLPPRMESGKWECDEGYELAGARFSWPGGELVVQPEKCTPQGNKNGRVEISILKGNYRP